MTADDQLIEDLKRWQAVKAEAMTGGEGADDFIVEPEYLARAAGLEPDHVAALQAIVEPQLREILLAAMGRQGGVMLGEAAAAALGESAAAYYVEALMFGHWRARQHSR